MGTPYTKPHLSFEEQLSKLESRGLLVENRELALQSLREIGYYRLSAYLHTFREYGPQVLPGHDHRLDSYVPGSTFDLALDLWRFDRRLRLDLLDGLEQFEVALRTAVAYRAGMVDAFIHHKPEILAPEFIAQPPTSQKDRKGPMQELVTVSVG